MPPEQQGRRRLQNSFWIKRELIVADPEQPRKEFNQQELSELAASIGSRGFKDPLTVRWADDVQCYMIIDGERRFRAATLLKVDELPCWVQKADGRDVLIDQIVHNWQRSNLRPYETADALARLRDEFSLSAKDLSVTTGKPKGEISKLLALHDKVIPEVQTLARGQESDGSLTRRHLYSISQLPDANQLDVARKVQDGQLTAIETEKLVKQKRPGTARKGLGLGARQRRFRTDMADVVITFRKSNITDLDVLQVLRQIEADVKSRPADASRPIL